jgi:hypothetical protein
MRLPWVVYDNATESDLLLRSLQRALTKDKASCRITNPDFGPLFSHIEAADDLPTGYIYVLRSKSDHPFIAENQKEGTIEQFRYDLETARLTRSSCHPRRIAASIDPVRPAASFSPIFRKI